MPANDYETGQSRAILPEIPVVDITFFTHLGSPFLIVNNTDEIVEINEAAAALFGYNALELQGSYVGILFPTVVSLFTASQQNEKAIQALGHHKQSSWLSLQLHTTAFKALHNQVCYGYVRLQNQVVEQENSSLLAATSKAASVGGFEYDLLSQQFSWTETTYLIHDLPLSAQPTLAEIFTYYNKGANKNEVEKCLNQALETGVPFDVETELITPKGMRRWVRLKGYGQVENGRCIKIIGAIFDIDVQKQAEWKLEQSRQRYMSLFYQNPDAVFSLSPNGVVKEVNLAAASMIGLEKEALLEHPFIHYTPEEDQSTIAQLLSDVANGGTATIETSIISAHESMYTAELTLMPVVVNGKVLGVYAIAKDISERKKTATKLQRIVEILEETSSIGRVGGYEVDFVSETAEWTSVMKEIHELPHSYEPNLDIMFCKEGASRDILMDHLDKARTLGTPYDIEIQIVTAKGNERWIRATGNTEFKDGKCIRLYGIVQDIHEQKLVREKLESEQNLLRTLIDNLPLSVFIKDAEGRKLVANQFDLRFMEQESMAAVIGKTDKELFANFENHFGYEQDMKVLHTGESLIEEAGSFTTPSGRTYHTIVSKLPLRNEKGEIKGIIGLSRDVTATVNVQYRLNIVDFAFQKAAISIFLIRPDATFYDFNEIAHTKLGYTKEEMLGFKVADINPEFSVEGWPFHWEELKAAGSLVFNSVELRKDGSLMDVEIKANIIQYGGMELNCAFVTDITEQKKAQEALQKSYERYEYAMMATSDCIWEADLTDDTLFLSKNFEPTFGHKVSSDYESGNDNPWIRNVHPDDLPYVLAASTDVIKGKEGKWQSEYRLKKANGDIALVLNRGFIVREQAGKAVKLIGAMQDVTIKKKEEERLKLLETVITHTTDSIIILSAAPSLFADLPIIYVNDTFTKMTGYSFEEVAGQSPNLLQGVLTDRYELKRIKWAIKHFMPFETEIINYKKNGTPFWINLSIVPVADKTGKYTHWVAIQRDITARKQSEQAFLEISSLQSSILNSANLAIISTDTTGLIKSFNVCAENMLGYSELEVVNKQTPMLFHDEADVQNRVHQLYTETGETVLPGMELYVAKAKQGETTELESVFVKKNGDKFPVSLTISPMFNNDSKIIGFLGIAKDISTEKQIAKQLSDSYAALESTINELNQQKFAIDQHSIVAITDVKGIITYANDNFCNISKYSRQELLGKDHRIIKSGHHSNEFFKQMYHTIGNGMVWHGEICNKAKDGSLYWVNTTIVPYLDTRTNKPLRYISIRSDITERKKAELEREHLLDELTQNNRELKQFSYITTHNLRAPLTNLISICKLIKEDTILDERTRRLIDGFKRSTHHLNETLDDLIEVLIIKENRNLPTHLLSFPIFLDKVSGSIQSIINHAGATISSDFTGAEFVYFNASYLESIFLNLITNSIKYAHPDRKPEISVRSWKEENSTKLAFTDNGLGMDLDRIQNRIFGLYQRFHNNADSKGIGLYLIHSQVTALGGKVEVASEVNKGTTFTISFK